MICKNKATYSTSKAAKEVIKKLKIKFNNSNLTSYKCPHCTFFHLTSCDSEERKRARSINRGEL